MRFTGNKYLRRLLVASIYILGSIGIVACWGGGGGGSSSTAPPIAPTGLGATATSSSSINLTWADNSSDEASFVVLRSTTSGSGFTTIATLGTNTTSYADTTGLSASTTYYYRVYATNSAGDSGFSNEAFATTNAPPGPTLPAAPTGLSATATSASSIDLSWTDNSSNETNFVVQRSTTSGSGFTTIATLGTNTTSYADTTGLSASTTYYYRVYATNSAGDSGFSNEAFATTNAPPGPTLPAAPTGLSATATSASSIDLSWTDNSSNETNFVVQRSTTSGSGFTTIATLGTNTTSYADTTGLSASTTYYYRVYATNSAGDSGFSNEAFATTNAPPVPASPQNALATAGDGQVTVTWDAVSGASDYTVYWNTTGSVATSDASIDAGANTQVVHSPLPNGTTHYYRVVASNLSGTSSLSREVSVQPMAQTIGHNWSWSHPLPQGNILLDIIWNGSFFIAVGAHGTILTSPDGTIWTEQVSGTINTLQDIAWTGTNFIVVGDYDTILTSPDGVTWTDLSLGPSIRILNGVTWTGTQYVVVGQSGLIMTSPDAVTWTERFSGTNEQLNNVLWNGSLIIAIGDGPNGSTTTVVLSNDGVFWSLQNPSVPVAVDLYGILWTGTEFYAVGFGGVLKSSDGISWTQLTIAGARFENIVQTNSHFVAVGFNSSGAGMTLTSPNGVTWTSDFFSSGANLFLSSLHGVAWNGAEAVIVGQAGVIYSSTDSTNWTQISTLLSPMSLEDITWTGTQYVAVGRGNRLLTSPDAVTWTLRPLSIPYDLRGVDSNGSIIVAAGSLSNSAQGKLLSSLDGISWSEVSVGIGSVRLQDVVWVNSLFIAVGEGGTIAVSPDGVLWSLPTKVTGSNLNSVAWTGTEFMAVGENGTILTSQDGIGWSVQTTGVYSNLRDITVSGSLIVVIEGGHFLTSNDGNNWTTRTPPSNIVLYSVVWTGSQLIAVGSGGLVLTSLDGITWSVEGSETAYELNDVEWGGGRLITVGNNGNILVSN